MHRCHAYCCLLRSRCWVSSHNALYFPFERESARCVTRPNIGCERDSAYCRSPKGEKIKIIRLQLVTSKIYFRVNLRPGWVNVAPDR